MSSAYNGGMRDAALLCAIIGLGACGGDGFAADAGRDVAAEISDVELEEPGGDGDIGDLARDAAAEADAAAETAPDAAQSDTDAVADIDGDVEPELAPDPDPGDATPPEIAPDPGPDPGPDLGPQADGDAATEDSASDAAADTGPTPCTPALCDDGDPCTADRCADARCAHDPIAPLTVVALTGFEPGDPPPVVVAQPGGHGWTVKATPDAPQGGFTLYGGNPQASPLGYGGPGSDATAILTMTVPAHSDTAQLAFALRLTAAPSSPARVEVRINGALRLSVPQTTGFERFRVPVLGLAGATVAASFRFVAQGGPGVLAGGAWLDDLRLEAAAPAQCLTGACVIDAGCPPADPCLSPRCLPSGVCGSVPVACDDHNPCTLDYCDGGICLTVPNPCDDANPCTIDGCDAGGCKRLGPPVTTSLIESWAGPNPLGAWQTTQPFGAPTWAVFEAADLPEPFSALGGAVLYMPRDVGIGGLSADGTATLPLPIGGGLGRVLTFQVALATVDAALTGDRFEVHLGDAAVWQASGTGVHTAAIALPSSVPAGTALTLKFRATGAPDLIGGVAVGRIEWRAVDKACAAFRPCVIDGQCGDGDPCTVERCVDLACKFEEVVCLPGHPCADAPCDADTLCTVEALACDDGDPCTADACAAPPGVTVNQPAFCSFEALTAEAYPVVSLDLESPAPNLELLAPEGGLGWLLSAGGLVLADAAGPVSDYGGAPVLAVLRYASVALPPEATLRLTFRLELDDADPFVDHLAVSRDGQRLWAASDSLGSPEAPVTVDIPLGAPGIATISLVFDADAPPLAGAGPWVGALEILGVSNPGCGAACVLAGGCDDGDPCTDDRCDAGACSHQPVLCDDGLACTTEACVDARCAVTSSHCESGTE